MGNQCPKGEKSKKLSYKTILILLAFYQHLLTCYLLERSILTALGLFLETIFSAVLLLFDYVFSGEKVCQNN